MTPTKRDPVFVELDRRIAEEDRRAALTPAARTRQALQQPAGKAVSPPCRQPASRLQPARSLDKSACGSKAKKRDSQIAQERKIEPWELRRARYLSAAGRPPDEPIGKRR